MTTITLRSLEQSAGLGLLAVAGSLSGCGAARLRHALLAASEQYKLLVADLRQADELSAEAVGALAEAAACLRWQGGDLAVVATGALGERLGAAGLAQAFLVTDEVAQAQQLLAHRP
jgi:anti-anti-sigma regulatory factor